jgi:hypothetical protein
MYGSKKNPNTKIKLEIHDNQQTTFTSRPTRNNETKQNKTKQNESKAQDQLEWHGGTG